jgi:hypothetical protein
MSANSTVTLRRSDSKASTALRGERVAEFDMACAGEFLDAAARSTPQFPQQRSSA